MTKRSPVPADWLDLVPAWGAWLLFMVLLFLRHPDGLLQADFWAEDGCVWYAGAYQDGWRSLLVPYAGYLQTAARLVALLAQTVPLRWGPTLFALAALAIQALPPTLLLSPRMRDAWPDPVCRLAFALIYVALPNASEVLANLTNAQWHLACLGFLLVVISPATRPRQQVADSLALALAALSGPFGLALLPIAVWQYLPTRDRAALWRLLILVACVALQGWSLLHTMAATRPHAELGADMLVLGRIVALQIVLGGLLGISIMVRLAHTRPWRFDAVPLTVALAGALLAAIAFLRGPAVLRKGIVWAGLILGAALLSPAVSLTEPQWPILTQVAAGNRYFLIPMLAWIGICLALARDRIIAVRGAAIGFLLLLPLGIVMDFHYPGTPPTGFAEAARQFQQAPGGTRMEFAVHPPGFQPMVLTKR